jgi:predicted RNase H-like HicB family nuclease
MNLTIEIDREVDGRWIAEVPELNVLLYGKSREDAIRQAENAAREMIADRIRRSSLPERPPRQFLRFPCEPVARRRLAASLGPSFAADEDTTAPLARIEY